MKPSTAILACAALCVASGSICCVLLRSSNHRAEAAEERMRMVCAEVKYALRIDRQLVLNDPRARDMMASRLGGDRFGDGAVMLEWCLPEPFQIDRWRACADASDYSCLELMLRAAEDNIR